MTDDVGFEVTNEVEVGDLSAVQQTLTPQATGVKVRVMKAAVQPSKAGDLKTLKTELKIVDGINVLNQETGVEELKFVNKSIFPGFMDLCIWANPETKVSQWYKNKQHLLGFKQFCQALDVDLSAVKINDEFLIGLVGRELLVNIVHEADTVKDETGKRQEIGTFSERIKGFKKAE